MLVLHFPTWYRLVTVRRDHLPGKVGSFLSGSEHGLGDFNLHERSSTESVLLRPDLCRHHPAHTIFLFNSYCSDCEELFFLTLPRLSRAEQRSRALLPMGPRPSTFQVVLRCPGGCECKGGNCPLSRPPGALTSLGVSCSGPRVSNF